MASKIALLCLLGLLVASPVIADSGVFYQLALMWPGAYCAQTNAGCCKPTSTASPARDFYISGFTVFNATTNAPVSGCDNKPPFDLNEIIGTQALNQYWSNIKCPSNINYVVNGWKNAWKKSGACSGLEEEEFFSKALDFRSRINPLVRLKAEGIEPDFGLYGLTAIKNVFMEGINATPLVKCSKGPAPFGKFQLYQLYFCASAEGTFIDCPMESTYTCPEEIIFHPFYKWMLKYQPKADYADADPFELPGVAMDN